VKGAQAVSVTGIPTVALRTAARIAPEEIDAAWASLSQRGLAEGRRVTEAGQALRQRLEDDTDGRTTLPWQLLGIEESIRFAERLEPACELLLTRVDETAGPNYQPASRVRRTTTGSADG